MTYPNPRIIYYGTPEFAVPALTALAAHGFNVVAVVTAADKPSGRGLKMQISAVKEKAIELGIPVLQPELLNDPDFLDQLMNLKVELQIVVAFRKLPVSVWKLPRLGTFNLHASLLPQYRGAAPINWVLINGEQQTGLSTFFIDEKIDTGKVILQEIIPVDADDDAGSLHDRLMFAGADLVIHTLEQIIKGPVTLTEQIILAPGMKLHLAPKLNKENCRINWTQSAGSIRNFVRGLCPYPAATAVLCNGSENSGMKIFRVNLIEVEDILEPGHLSTDGRNYLRVFTGNGCLEVLELQAEGRKRMSIADFLRGFQLQKDSFFKVF